VTVTCVPNEDNAKRGRHGASIFAQQSGSAFDEISRLCSHHDAVNLALGAPDLPTEQVIIDAAIEALRGGLNQYSDSWGDQGLREAISEKVHRHMRVSVDPQTEITVTCGTTEAMLDVALSLLSPGDEVILFEPFYSSYIPVIALSRATARYVQLYRPDWSFDEQELRAAFNDRTRVIVINTPGNPTGKVFNNDELHLIAELCREWDVIAISDEVYEHLVYDGREHRSMLQFEDLRERAVVLSGLSKTYSLTGWRIAYVIAPPELTKVIRLAHGYTTYCAPTPLQAAAICALHLPDSYYQKFSREMQARRDRLMSILERSGFICFKPAGAFYLMTDIKDLGYSDDMEFTKFLIKEIGVAAMPGSTFYSNRSDGNGLLRFCFGKSAATLDAAEERLSRLARRATTIQEKRTNA
jgi:aspartate/methionine/tyrosine aminotransferase